MVFCLVMFLVETSPMLWAQTADRSRQTPAPQTTQTKQEDTAPVPVGTAAAPYVKPEGRLRRRGRPGPAYCPRETEAHSFLCDQAGLLIGAGRRDWSRDGRFPE